MMTAAKTRAPGRCRVCGVSLAEAARFCGACGAETMLVVREEKRAARAGDARDRGVATALVLGFVGTFAAIFVGAMVAGASRSDTLGYLSQCALLVVVGCLAARRLELAPLCDLVWSTDLRGLCAGIAMGVLLLGVGWLYVRGLQELGLRSEPSDEALAMAVLAAVLAPLVEEWLCRGILWRACRRSLGVRGTVFLTAVLFALLHGLNGMAFLEIPSRFVYGVGFGVLRARTHSLMPGIVAHITLNATAVAIFG